ncbi:hypothetical protein GCM10020001_084610 [Nonomuraea salmonea]
MISKAEKFPLLLGGRSSRDVFLDVNKFMAQLNEERWRSSRDLSHVSEAGTSSDGSGIVRIRQLDGLLIKEHGSASDYRRFVLAEAKGCSHARRRVQLDYFAKDVATSVAVLSRFLRPGVRLA